MPLIDPRSSLGYDRALGFLAVPTRNRNCSQVKVVLPETEKALGTLAAATTEAENYVEYGVFRLCGPKAVLLEWRPDLLRSMPRSHVTIAGDQCVIAADP